MDNTNQKFKRKKKKSGFKTFLAFLFIFFISLLLVLVGLSYLGYSKYSEWRDGFENTRLSDEFYYVGSEDFQLAEKNLNKKLQKFQESEEDVDFVELEINEVIALLDNTLFTDENGDWQSIRYAVETQEGQWTVYAEFTYKHRILPWLIFTIDKDPIETPELYISDISIGNLDLDNFGLEFIKEKVNDGYSEAIVNINESGFTGRVWQNIELEAYSVIIKGKIIEAE